MTTPELTNSWFATAGRGIERFLIGELKTFGAENIEDVPGGVFFEGPPEVALRCCLWSRVASRVMATLGHARVWSEDDIYDAVRELPLDGWFDPDRTIACNVNTRGEQVKNSHFAALRIKDAVCDHVRDKTGRRPDVDLKRPDITVAANIRGTKADFYVELQGNTLHQRGYRKKKVEAPLRESLAAALVLFSGWRGEEPLHDIVCGSGTILIEAALIATNTAPGLSRKFGFQKLPWFAELQPTWERLRSEAMDLRETTLEHPLYGSDISSDAIAASERNAREAGVDSLMGFTRQTIDKVDPFPNGGMFIGNPPYGERLLDDTEAVLVHEDIDQLAWSAKGHRLCLLSMAPILKKTIGLKHERILDTKNGPLDVRMALYEIREPSDDDEG
jgi:23S rRNA (guanine2445-N2)-methyltransferase / 23S rRNA (guanine2069-N7)-methyltransferase